MPFDPSAITREHVLQAIERVETQKIDLKPATRFHVIISGKPYPPKEVMRYAHEQMNGERLWDHSGGSATNKFLERMGFEVGNKRGMDDPIPPIIQKYKELIRKTKLDDELYKWRLVEKFKGRPDLDATDFGDEILQLNYHNLVYQIARSVMHHLARESPEPYRATLRELFDENMPWAKELRSS